MTTDTIPLNRITRQLERLTSHGCLQIPSYGNYLDSENIEALRIAAETTTNRAKRMQNCSRIVGPVLLAAIVIGTSKALEAQCDTTPVISIEDFKRLAGSIDQESESESLETDPPKFGWTSCDYDVLNALEEFSSHTHGDY